MYNSDARRYAFLPLAGYLLVILLFAMGGYLEKIGALYEAGILMLIAVVLLFAAGIYTIVAEVKFMIEAAKSPYLSTFKKILWAFFFYAFNILAFPIYWYFHFYRIARKRWKAQQEENRKAFFYDAELTAEERKEIRRRNREFTYNQRKEKREKAAQERIIQKDAEESKLSTSKGVGIVTVLPVLLLLCAIILDAYEISFGIEGNDFNYIVIPAIKECIVFAIIVCELIVVILFEIHAWKNKNFNKQTKICWMILLIIFNVLISPIYWDIFICNKTEKQKLRRKKLALIAIIIPIIMIAIFVVAIAGGNTMLGNPIFWFVFKFTGAMSILSYIFMLLLYGIIICENEQLSTGEKGSWILGLFFVGLIAGLVYYRSWVCLEEKMKSYG